MSGVVIEGFDCVSETPIVDSVIDTYSIINSYIKNFVYFGNNRCLTDLSTYDYCKHFYTINIKIKNIALFNLTKTKYILSEKHEILRADELSNNIKVLTKMYDAIKTFDVKDPNPFGGKDPVNQPKPCRCYTKIMDNFDKYYIKTSNYDSITPNAYYSVIRYFFDVYDATNKITYTGMGNLKGDYTQDYYDTFVTNSEIEYIAPSEIQTEIVDLMNADFKYYLNYYSRYLLLNAPESKYVVLSFINNLAHVLRANYNNIDVADGEGGITKAFYDISSNPFPNKAKQVNSNIHINDIIKKVKSKTFKDYEQENNNSGSTPTKDTTNVLNRIVDRKYFVAYLTAVKQAIVNTDKDVLSKVDVNQDWDPTNQVINNDFSKSMLLTDQFLLDADPNHMYDLMDYFGEFDKLTNKYKVNPIGLIVIKQLSEDHKKIISDYLDRMCILAFTPVKYGGEVNYDRWMFYK